MSAAQPRVVDTLVRDPAGLRAGLAAGLAATPARIPPKYFYDGLGAALFDAICELPEYYVTRTEQAIVDANLEEIAAFAGRGRQIVDLGAGNGAKAERLMPALAPARYVPVDISRKSVEATLARLAPRFPAVAMTGVVTDFTAGLELGDALAPGPVTFLYPGSSIGNFSPDEALAFLRRVHAHCAGRPASGLLIGADTRKDPLRLCRAYDDPLGVTALFNRNALNHVNRVLGTDFDPAGFAHRALYDAELGRVEMHLEALRRMSVRLPSGRRVFEAGERIHTENSYKYDPIAFATLLERAGFAASRTFTDSAGDFAVYWARP
jgi:dimethylhistidine N-methyltransferase